MRRIPLALAALLGVAVLAASPAAGVPDQTPKRGGALVFRLIGPGPPCLNFLSELCSPLQTAIIDAVLAKPFVVGPDFVYRSQLATAGFTKRRPFTLTYRIRPDARWSDGVPITARDFVFTLRAIRKYGPSDLRELHAVVRSIRVVDAKTVRVVLRPRSSEWRELFGNVLPEHAIRGTDLSKVWTTSIDNPRTGEPIGSGPFLVDHWDRGSQLVLRRNRRYWGRHAPYLDRIVVRFWPTATDPTAELRAGDLDIATGVPPEVVPAVRRLPGIRVRSVASPGFEHLEFRLGAGGHPALGNKLVRRALAYGIDRVALVRQVFGAIGSPKLLSPLDSAVIVRGSPFYEGTWSRYRYRPAQA